MHGWGELWDGWLRRVRLDTAQAARKVERESFLPDAGAAESAPGPCPSCDAPADYAAHTCANCGFPFVCEISPQDELPQRRPAMQLRRLLGVIAILFWLVGATLLSEGNSEYNGFTTDTVSLLTPDTSSGVSISGPASFVRRTEYALALLKLRAPDYYLRLRESVDTVTFLSRTYLEGPEGRKISLEGIGAVAEPATRLVQVVSVTAYPTGVENLYDYDVFSYAGVLVHELRHIELHYMGTAPGGWEEEALCERAAYDMLLSAGAPKGVLLRYQLYFDNPHARRYQHWYDWYKQFD